MDMDFNIKKVHVEYIGGKSVLIQAQLYLTAKWCYSLKLSTIYQGCFKNDLTQIVILSDENDAPFIHREDTKIIEYIQEHKLEVIQKLKYGMEDVVLDLMNKHDMLHEYRVGWMVS